MISRSRILIPAAAAVIDDDAAAIIAAMIMNCSLVMVAVLFCDRGLLWFGFEVWWIGVFVVVVGFLFHSSSRTFEKSHIAPGPSQ